MVGGDTAFQVRNALIVNTAFSCNSTGIYFSNILFANSTTANNAAYLNGVAASGYQTTAGLASNVAGLSSNNAAYLGGTIAGSYALTSSLSSYQTIAGLSANVAGLSSNNAAYLNGVAAASYALTSSLSSYQTTSGLSSNVAGLSSNNAAYLGGTIASGYQTTAGLNTNVAAYLPTYTGSVGGSYGFKNRIINGDMRIDQRNVGGSQTVTTAGAYTADCWQVTPVGNSVTGQRTGPPYNYVITGRTGLTSVYFNNKIESSNIYDLVGVPLTLSAKISSTSLSNVSLNVISPVGLDNWATFTNFANSNISITSTPTVYSMTFTPSANCANGLGVSIQTGAFTSGTLTITDVQLEKGTVVTSYERMPIEIKLVSCQRYYQKSYNQATVPGTVPGSSASVLYTTPVPGSGFSAFIRFPVVMCKVPGITIWDVAGNIGKISYYDGGSWHDNAIGFLAHTEYDFSFSYQVSAISNLTAVSFDYILLADL